MPRVIFITVNLASGGAMAMMNAANSMNSGLGICSTVSYLYAATSNDQKSSGKRRRVSAKSKTPHIIH